MIGNLEYQIQPSAPDQEPSAEQPNFADLALGLGLAVGVTMLIRWVLILSDKLRDWAEKSPPTPTARPRYYSSPSNPGDKPPSRGPS